MTKYACSESKLTALGDAIRDKAGTTGKMTLDEMAAAVEGISTGYELPEGLTYYTAGDSIPEGTSTTDSTTPGCGGNVAAAYGPNVTNIGKLAFYGCTNLTSIDLPNATSIGDYAFKNCTALTSVDLPSAINVGNQAFYDCTNLTSVDLPKVTSIGESAFDRCGFTSIDLPSATEIGESAFESCYKILVVDLGKVKTIGRYAFKRCLKLTTLVIRQSNSVATLGTSSFYVDWPNKSALTAIYVPDALVSSYKSDDDWSSYASMIKPLSEYEG